VSNDHWTGWLCHGGQRAKIDAAVAESKRNQEPGAVDDCLDEDQAVAWAFADRDSPRSQAQARHVDSCQRCQALVAEAMRALLSVQPSGGLAQSHTLRTGEVVLDRYEIRRFIGAGGMGEVYEALDRELGETIALKTVALTTLDDQRSIARLKAEVQLARRITHPNVCRIFDFGVHLRRRPGLIAEPVPLLTMELLAGETLAASLRGGAPLTTSAARPILDQILAGLGAVHGAGIVHRDLKAENVFLVTRGPTERRAVLMDFGLARAALPEGQGPGSFSHALVGTAAYMAPEQVEGRPVSFASDIYAAGVLLFEMVTGRLPFVGATTMEVALARLKGDPPRPSALVPGLDPRWEEVILRCLAREPADRFRSVEEIGRALDGSSDRRGGRLRRAAPVVAAAALAITLGVTWLGPVRSRAPRASEILAPRLAAWHAAELVHSKAIEEDPAHAYGHLVDRAIVREDRAVTGGPEALADFAAAERDLVRAMTLEPDRVQPYHRRGRLRVERAQHLMKLGLDASADLAAAEADLRRALPLEPARSWLGLLQYVRGLWRIQRGEDGRPDFEAAEATLIPATTPDALMRRGLVRTRLGRFDDAERDFQDATRAAPEHPWVWLEWGVAREQAHDYVAAEAHLSRALFLEPELATAWEERGNVRFSRQAYADAATDYEQAIAINPVLGPLLGSRLREARARAAR
jgi:tetratricopeptide (TPR) repeat protein